MAQMASLLVVATVFVALWTLNIYILQSERGGGLYTRQNYLCRNLSQNCRGGLYARGGVFAGFYGTCNYTYKHEFTTIHYNGYML